MTTKMSTMGKKKKPGWSRRKKGSWGGSSDRLQRVARENKFDKSFGFDQYIAGPTRLGWLLNFSPTVKGDAEGTEHSALDLFFLQENGETFKATYEYLPYFYVGVKNGRHKEVGVFLKRKFDKQLVSAQVVELEDMDLPNHLSGIKRAYLKLSFLNTRDLMDVRKLLRSAAEKNQKLAETTEAYATFGRTSEDANCMDIITELREYDVPYHIRVCIDKDFRVGAWYNVTPDSGSLKIEWLKDRVQAIEPRVLAFDIECTKAPLKFPNADVDEIFMISYMFDGKGFLILSRKHVSKDVADFEYTPKPEYPGPFHCFNEKDERALLRRFFDHVKAVRPNIIVTYNGDGFDWPFVDKRAAIYGINMEDEIGIKHQDSHGGSGEYVGRCMVHLDAFHWVKRDSYLPQGSQGLKSVTRYKLGYDPVEVDYEDMLRLAADEPEYMAAYSVSDAVATYYLYMKYVHSFIFSLCTIIPMGGEDVLRKGSGTLCEQLLMVEAFRGNIVCPNKQKSNGVKFFKGHPLSNETYVGGHVEALEAGVYRCDIPVKFRLDPAGYQRLIDDIDDALVFALEVEGDIPRDKVSNYDEVKAQIVDALAAIRDSPMREEKPVIYHLDVGAMYPNIILTNRLQPHATVDATVCAACDFNDERNRCKRRLEWEWRGDYMPASRHEYEMMKTQIQFESINDVPFHELSINDQNSALEKRMNQYCQTVYKKRKITENEIKTATICQRENPFYVNTVLAFRDRRYEYKRAVKTWAKKARALKKGGNVMEYEAAKSKVVLYDSLQLAHKCILNSFYGYVMRKGARWQSMEMAGVVTRTGGNLIKEARVLIDQIGKPLELDTDGIWCILPSSFPENFQFKKKDGGTYTISYPCVMLNIDVNKNYTNDQYQTLAEGSGGVGAMKRYNVRSECSIFFEVDGPYRGMILPASTEEGRLLKKRYAVFNMNGTLAELKGFELKRRGELQVIKTFQSQVFEKFLVGESLEGCYKAVANVANFWLDVLYSQGEDMEDDEVIALISEKKNLSRALADYGAQKSRAITTARRLADLLGPEMVKDPGLNCNMVIARLPAGGTITERSIPTIIFEVADMHKRRKYLRRWLKDPGLQDIDIRSILDWNYYVERFSDCVRKIITIPAALQRVANPVERVPHPDWLKRFVREQNDPFKQQKISAMFQPLKKGEKPHIPAPQTKAIMDIEDMFDPSAKKIAPVSPPRTSAPKKAKKVTPQAKKAKKRRGKSAWLMFVSDRMKNMEAVAPGTSKMKAVSAEWKALTKDERQKYEEAAKALNAKQAEEDRIKAEEEAARLDSPSKRASPSREGDEDEEAAKRGRIEDEAPPSTASWLQRRKRSWKRQRDARAARNTDADMSDIYGASEATGYDEEDAAENKRRRQATNAGLLKKGLGTFLKAQSQSITFGYWQIISVAETRTPGDLKLFVMTSPSTMQAVTVRVPRVVYVNSRRDTVDLGVGRLSPTDKMLPRACPARNLFELSLPEPAFRRRSKELDTFLTASDIEGVYESQVPSVFKCVVSLGCVTRVRPQMRKQLAGKQVFSLEHLEFLKTSTYRYMAPKSASFKRVYVYHSRMSNRSVWAFFRLGGTNAKDDRTATCSLCFVTPKGSSLAPFDADSLYADFAQQYHEEMEACAEEGMEVPPPRVCSFEEPEVVHTRTDGNAVVRSWFEKFHQQCRGAPAIVIFQSGATSVSELCKVAPLIEDNLPVVQLTCNESDNRYPALGWENFALERVCQRALAVDEWLKNILERARYAHVPIGNLSNDPSSEMADVLYSRLLWTNKHLLWMSPGALPDLGGREFDEALTAPSLVSCSVDPDAQSKVQSASSAFEQAENPNYCVSGMYRTICVELSIKNLAVNTLLKASLIAQMEGSDSSLALDMIKSTEDDGAAAGLMEGVEFLDESAACGTAFRVLRVLANNWFRDVAVDANQVADTLLLNIYRWLCSPASKLYEPAIHSMLNRLMRKLFLQLLAELRRLGSTVVHATFSKIIICTNKMTLDHAQSYVDYIVQTLKARDLFEWVVVEPQTFWGQLLFLNGCNFGGVKISTGLEPDMMQLDDEDEDGPVGASQVSQIISNWNLAEYLTPHAQQFFEIAVGEIIDKPFQFQQKQVAKLMDSCITLNDDNEEGAAEAEMDEAETEPQGDANADDEDGASAGAGGSGKASTSLTSTQIVEAVRTHAREVVRDFLTPTLLRFVPEIEREDDKDSFPQLAGSYRKMENPASEFVKSVCHVLAIDADITEEVTVLKRELNRLIGVREFSKESQFRSPCLSFVLPDVICEFCNNCEDLDLCRDPLLADPSEQDVQARWRCRSCDHNYDVMHIEQRLVQYLQNRSVSYQLQDLCCQKCKSVKDDNIRQYCECSGTFRCAAENPQNMEALLKVFKNIATFHKFEWLEETVAWMTELQM